MALPAVQSVYECADYSKTVEPFIPQFYDLPAQILRTFAGSQSFYELYLSTNPLISAFALSLALSPIFLVIAEVNRNYSQVDRAWSLLPTLYNAHYALYAHLAGLPTQRIDLLLAVSCIWSVSEVHII